MYSAPNLSSHGSRRYCHKRQTQRGVESRRCLSSRVPKAKANRSAFSSVSTSLFVQSAFLNRNIGLCCAQQVCLSIVLGLSSCPEQLLMVSPAFRAAQTRLQRSHRLANLRTYPSRGIHVHPVCHRTRVSSNHHPENWPLKKDSPVHVPGGILAATLLQLNPPSSNARIYHGSSPAERSSTLPPVLSARCMA